MKKLFFGNFIRKTCCVLCIGILAAAVGCRNSVIVNTSPTFESSLESDGQDAAQKTTEAASEVTTEETTTVIPTITEQPYNPEIPLGYFRNFALILDTVKVGNMRDQPSMGGNIIGRLYSNSGIDLLQDMGNGWFMAASGGITGYVSATLVNTGEQAKEQAVRYGNAWVAITADSLNVRVKPDLDSSIIARVTVNQTYPLVGETDEWYLISIGEAEGYVSKQYARLGYSVGQAEMWNQLNNLSGNAKTIVSWGMQYLGLKYVFGGESFSSGVDCSYFTKSCFAQIGISLPRTSREQVNYGNAVSAAEMQPGDLLFYASHGTGINHVAIYIGDGKILHAAESVGCVSISAYNYCGEPVAVRRYF